MQQTAPFSIHDAVNRALAQNPSVQIANIQAAEAQEGRKPARAGLLPQAQLQFGEDIQRFNVESLIGLRIPQISQHIGPFQALTPGTAFSAPIFDLTLWRKYGAAKDRALAARSDTKTTREETALLVVSQYLGALRASSRVRAAVSTRDLAQALLRQAKDLEIDGFATKIDVLRAEVRLKQDQQTLLQAQTDARLRGRLYSDQQPGYSFSGISAIAPACFARLTFGAVLTPAMTNPAIQGWLADSYNWTSLFGIALLFCVAGLLLMLNSDCRGMPMEKRARFDWIGAPLYLTALFCMVYFLSRDEPPGRPYFSAARPWGFSSSPLP